MHVSNRHVLRQGAVLGALGRTAALALGRSMRPGPGTLPELPGPWLLRSRRPLPRALVDDYLRHVGGDPRAYRGLLPAHLFPYWAMPLLARTLEALPYPLLRVVNGGCRIEVGAALPDDEPLEVRARLLSVDDNGRRAVLEQELLTGTQSAPDALAINFYAVVPLRASAPEAGARAHATASERAPQGPTDGGPRAPRPSVPLQARELAYRELTAADALGYAKLTGDFNPIHWLSPYARASGFGSVILHGFASLAMTWEDLTRNLFGGDVRALSSFDVKLLRPLTLPHRVGSFVQGDQVFVGSGRGGPAFLGGRFSPAPPNGGPS